ncbi:P-loop containing nucleoside triphosphate hydrolase protein [Cantharellus anzutake]|uniref:P-loop containing nucleoside triphosphate hydrolase protein n=1 Tax=Cantharellus anzutake TaxID=1750568 RepID=UPI0019075291|nr:P-loop containing nucleoside triphosphate hydrolase protein [Cantharellus anzutake]XP_038916868.1 P-loop containing nucleoside triphosphate hydrolase protein [Cantharellus anzutake]KAF8318290.1 P-loop containing nucleoside triphosphate hydrolase protein [Cantharellus anzutake]KAF8332574.1 P-loop containing nucleoside triphosphate hydrolase protein [Cantharellus anzutake]
MSFFCIARRTAAEAYHKKASCVQIYIRQFRSSFPSSHQNPLGLPRSGSQPPPTIPTRAPRRQIPNAGCVIAVASGKGGVGKSTVATNLALALAMTAQTSHGRSLRVGLLDLDIFGPSIPKLMGLENSSEPELTKDGHLVPLHNHSIACMSMGFLLPRSTAGDAPAVVWRGLMVQKATQQLLFDVDWRDEGGRGLDALVVDMPPGTGDVALTFGQLAKVDGAVIVSTPQDVALIDVAKGVSMFRKVDIPILGVVLNMSHFVCPSCSNAHQIFGPTTSFHNMASDRGIPVLGELPLVSSVSTGGDCGIPAIVGHVEDAEREESSNEVKRVLSDIARSVWKNVGAAKG